MKYYLKPNFTIASLLLFPLLLSAAALEARAQDQGARDRALKLKVGAGPQSVKGDEPVNLWAVIIGVSRYKYGDQNLDGNVIPNLKNAADDAQAIYDFLRSPEGGGFRDESEGGHMVLLKDEQATKASVEKALDGLKKTRPNDYFVLYIAAHGMIFPKREAGSAISIDVPYFVLYDSDLRDPHNTSLRMDRFRNIVAEVPAQKGMVLSDTCHSGAVLLEGRDTSATYVRANASYIDEMKKIPEGVGFISAAGPNEKARESDEFYHGIFTACLLDALSGIADKDQSQSVTFDELVTYLVAEVPRLTDGKQTPYHKQTSLGASRIALSVVNYVDSSAGASAGKYGVLRIRTPDVDGVEVSIDDAPPIATLDSRTERPLNVPAGVRKVSFTKGQMKRSLEMTVEPGRSKPVEVNLTFSESDEDDVTGGTNQQVTVYLTEARVLSGEAKDLFQKGVDLFNKQKFQDAARQLGDAVKKTPGGAYPEALVYLGRAYQSLGQNDLAIKSFEAVLAVRPSDYQTETLLAEAKFEGGNVAEAASKLQNIIKRYPNYAFARVVYGDLLLSRNEMARAERELRQAVRINPRYPPARLILADALTHQDSRTKQQMAVKEAQQALLLFREVSNKSKSAGAGLKRLSISHVIFGGGRYVNEAAMAEAHHMVAKTLTNLVNDDRSMADIDAPLNEARTHLQEALKIARTQSSKIRLALVLETSALNYFLKGDLAKAIEEAEQAVKIGGQIPALTDWPDPHLTLAAAYESNQQFAKAADNLQKFKKKAGSKLSADEQKRYTEEINRLLGEASANRQKN